MLVKYAVATVAGIAGLCGPGLVAQPEAATPSHTLLVRPGVGIGLIKVGETLTTLKKQFPHVTLTLGGRHFQVRIDGKRIAGGLPANRIRAGLQQRA